MSYDAGAIDGRLTLDIDPFLVGLAKATVKADEFEAKHGVISSRVDVDTAVAEAKLAALAAQIDAVSGAGSSEGSAAAGSAGGAAGGGGGGLLALVGIAAGLAPALGPATAAVGLFGTAAVAGFGAAAVSAAGYAKVVETAYEAMEKAHKAGIALPPVVNAAYQSLQNLKSGWIEFQAAIDPGVYRVMADSFEAADKVLPHLVPLVNAFSTGLHPVINDLEKLFTSKDFDKFIRTMSEFAEELLPEAGHTLTNLLSGTFALFRALEPEIRLVSGWLEDISRDFDHWAHVKAPGWLENLLAYVQRYGPQTKAMFGAMGDAIASIASGLGQDTGSAIHLLTVLFEEIAAIDWQKIGRTAGRLFDALADTLPKVADGLNGVIWGVDKLTQLLGSDGIEKLAAFYALWKALQAVRWAAIASGILTAGSSAAVAGGEMAGATTAASGLAGALGSLTVAPWVVTVAIAYEAWNTTIPKTGNSLASAFSKLGSALVDPFENFARNPLGTGGSSGGGSSNTPQGAQSVKPGTGNIWGYQYTEQFRNTDKAVKDTKKDTDAANTSMQNFLAQTAAASAKTSGSVKKIAVTMQDVYAALVKVNGVANLLQKNGLPAVASSIGKLLNQEQRQLNALKATLQGIIDLKNSVKSAFGDSGLFSGTNDDLASAGGSNSTTYGAITRSGNTLNQATDSGVTGDSPQTALQKFQAALNQSGMGALLAVSAFSKIKDWNLDPGFLQALMASGNTQLLVELAQLSEKDAKALSAQYVSIYGKTSLNKKTGKFQTSGGLLGDLAGNVSTDLYGETQTQAHKKVQGAAADLKALNNTLKKLEKTTDGLQNHTDLLRKASNELKDVQKDFKEKLPKKVGDATYDAMLPISKKTQELIEKAEKAMAAATAAANSAAASAKSSADASTKAANTSTKNTKTITKTVKKK